MKKKLKEWIKENYSKKISYAWYARNVPVELEDSLLKYKKELFKDDYLK